MTFKKLIQGFRHFQHDYFAQESTLFEKLSEGQSPETMIIACSDSRIDPAIVTRSEPGEIFSVRNVAAMVAPYDQNNNDHGTGAAVEYAVTALGIRHLVVMGHAQCGGVRALAESDGKPCRNAIGFIMPWISIGRKARNKVMKILAGKRMDQKLRTLEQTSILVSLNNLMTYPWVKEAVDAGKLHLHGWYFDFPNGQLLSYDPTTIEFSDVLKSQGKPAVTANCNGDEILPVSLNDFIHQAKDYELLPVAAKGKAGGNVLRSAVCYVSACCGGALDDTCCAVAGLL